MFTVTVTAAISTNTPVKLRCDMNSSLRGPTARCIALSEIHLLGLGDLRFPGLFTMIVFTTVLGADRFRPDVGSAPERDGRRPGRGEHTRILDGETILQVH